jgi:hypothetical protein
MTNRSARTLDRRRAKFDNRGSRGKERRFEDHLMRWHRAVHVGADVAYFLGCGLLIASFPASPCAGGWLILGLAGCGFFLALAWSVLCLFLETSSKHATQAVVAVTLMFMGSLWIGRGAPQASWLPSRAAGALWFAGCGFVLLVTAIVGLRAGRDMRRGPIAAGPSEQRILAHLKAVGVLNIVAGSLNILSGLLIGALMSHTGAGGAATVWHTTLDYALPAVATALGCIQVAAGWKVLARRRGARVLGVISAALGWASFWTLCFWPLLAGVSVYTAALLSRRAVRQALASAVHEPRAENPVTEPP